LYIEQPIALSAILLALYERSAVPIFATECRTKQLSRRHSRRVHGASPSNLAISAGFCPSQGSPQDDLIRRARWLLKVKLGCYDDGVVDEIRRLSSSAIGW
jgi:hypothetical protein